MGTRAVRRGDATITAAVHEPRGAGNRGTVVVVPSLGRGGQDFARLAADLGDAGYRAVAVDPRGLDGRGLERDLTLHDLAADVAAMIAAVAGSGADAAPVHLVGHALGNRIARCLAADRPDLVASLTLLAAGGLVEPAPEAWAALAGCFVLDRPADAHLADVAYAFFADPAGAAVWRGGWYPAIAAVQRDAVARTDRDDWWAAVAPRVLVIQGLQDRIAVPDNGRRYVAGLRDAGTAAQLVELDRAGHALLPEQPAAIADALVGFLRAGATTGTALT